MSQLLVSVRSVAEAREALAGGAALIDVKEPSHGSLGRAPDETIAAIVRFVRQRRPVSAALGELREMPAIPTLHEERRRLKWPAVTGLAYVKWGLAGYGSDGRWQAQLARAGELLNRDCRLVVVAYADWRQAQAPPVAEVCSFACARRGLRRAGGLLLDTWAKNGKTLLDCLPVPEIERLCLLCRNAGVRVALAGGLQDKYIRLLTRAEPDWFAVRSAACRRGYRTASIDRDRVRKLVEVVAESWPPGAEVDGLDFQGRTLHARDRQRLGS